MALQLRLRVAEGERCSPFFPGFLDDPKADKTLALIDDIVRCTGIEQRRRLRSADRYRQPAFVIAYLRHLDVLRYDHPREALKLLQVVGCELIPEVEARPIERQVLCLYTLAIFGSACRVQGDLASGRRLPALRARRGDGEPVEFPDRRPPAAGRLRALQRLPVPAGASTCWATPWCSTTSSTSKRRSARCRCCAAPCTTRWATRCRPPGCCARRCAGWARRFPEMRPFRGAAYQQLAIAYENAGDGEAAEEHLRHALAVVDGGSASQAAEMIWHHGWLAYQRGDLQAAERRLREARARLQEPGGLAFALVSLDLARVLLVRGQGEEAMMIAQEMASLLRGSKKTAAIEQSLLGFVRLALEGRLTAATIERFDRDLQKQGARRPGALLQP